MPQTTVQFRQKTWLTEGQYASTDYRTIEGAIAPAYNGNTGILPFGRVSQMVPGTRQVTTLSGAPASGRLLIVPIYAERYGIELSVLHAAAAPAALGYPDEPGVLVEYLTRGDIVMWSEVAVAAGDPVFARHTAAGGNTVLGRVRNAADSTNTVAMTGWRFAQSTTAAGLVAVSINGLIKVA